MLRFNRGADDASCVGFPLDCCDDDGNRECFFLHSQLTCVAMATPDSSTALLQERVSNPSALFSDLADKIVYSTEAERFRQGGEGCDYAD